MVDAGRKQVRGSVKQPAVLADGVAVGHAGHEVGHHRRALRLAPALRSGAPRTRQLPGFAQ